MAKQVKLTALARTQVGRTAVKKIKAAGRVPAVIYGAKQPPQALHVGAKEITALLAHAIGENILVELEIDTDGAKQTRLALIQEVQHETIGRKIMHIDFHTVDQNETLTASIPIEPFGEANGVKNFGGLLEQSLRELEVECLPKDLPELITVDVSALNVGDALHVKDIVLPAGVTAVDDAELTVFLVAEPTVADETLDVEAPTAPEVIKEKKEDPAADKK